MHFNKSYRYLSVLTQRSRSHHKCDRCEFCENPRKRFLEKCRFLFTFNRKYNIFKNFSSEFLIMQTINVWCEWLHAFYQCLIKVTHKICKQKPPMMHISFPWPNISIEAFNWRRVRSTIFVSITAKNDNFVFNGKCAMARSCDSHIGRLKV